MCRMGLGRRLAERYRGKLFRGTRVCGRWSRSTSFSPVRGTFLGRRRNGRHAPAPLEYRGSRRAHNRANVGDTRRGAERRLWGESSPVVARLPRRDNLQPSSISVTPTDEVPQTWPTEGDLAEEIVVPTPSWPTASGSARGRATSSTCAYTWTRRRASGARLEQLAYAPPDRATSWAGRSIPARPLRTSLVRTCTTSGSNWLPAQASSSSSAAATERARR